MLVYEAIYRNGFARGFLPETRKTLCVLNKFLASLNIKTFWRQHEKRCCYLTSMETSCSRCGLVVYELLSE